MQNICKKIKNYDKKDTKQSQRSKINQNTHNGYSKMQKNRSDAKKTSNYHRKQPQRDAKCKKMTPGRHKKKQNNLSETHNK